MTYYCLLLYAIIYAYLFGCCFRFLDTIELMLEKDLADNRAIGEVGADAILKHAFKDNSVRILTHCNTGALATSGYGTAMGVIRSLNSRNRLGEYFSYGH